MSPKNPIPKSWYLFSICVTFAANSPFVAAQEQEVPGLFKSNEPIHIQLTMDIRSVLRDLGDHPSNHPAVLSYNPGDGDTLKIPLKIRPRGHFRKDPMNCNFPPLRLDFTKTTAKGTLFEEQNKIKLVTHCITNMDIFEQNVLKEYLAYKLYNLLTEESFRVRLVKVTYIDESGRKDPLEKMGFLIEPEKQMALRNQCEIMNALRVHQERTYRHKITVLSVFQYMIGNTDWSTRSEEGPHNIVLIREKPGAIPVAVPFDFDCSGLVNSSYAKPAPNLGIPNVRTRLFRGFCRTEDELQVAFDEFRKRKEDIYRSCREVPYLEPKQLSEIEEYLNDFFEILEDPRAVKKEFHDNCRTLE